MHEAGARHRFDRRPQRLPVPAETPRELAQAVRIRGRRADLQRLSPLIQQVEVDTLAAEIQTKVQHGGWASSRSLSVDNPEAATEEALLHPILLEDAGNLPVPRTPPREAHEAIGVAS